MKFNVFSLRDSTNVYINIERTKSKYTSDFVKQYQIQIQLTFMETLIWPVTVYYMVSII